MSLSTKPIHRAWWKECSVYQIWPRSYKDSNDDGIGDIPGIISQLDYIHKLGVDIVWLCPSYKSPQVDMGYDIADYYSIADEYGTVADVEALIRGCHQRGMKLLMDLVVNHTSDQHEWFKQSRSSKDNEYRDWYIWKPAKYDEAGNREPPNNWVSHFQGSAWQYDELTDEYYLHLFAPEQPDLNWEHPPVRKAVHDIIRFWLEKGCDGYRMDVINFISKHQRYPNAPIQDPHSPWQSGDRYYANGPRLHEYLQDIGKILKEHDAFSVGEMPFVTDEQEVLRAVQAGRNELNMIFSFEHVNVDHGKYGKFDPGSWELTDLKSFFERWQPFMYENDGWNALYWENHDQPRSIDRYTEASEEHEGVAAKMLAVALALQSGTPFIYQGQELGMRNVPKSWGIEKYQDIDCLNHWKLLLKEKPSDTAAQKIALQEYQKKSRDNARTPVQWSDAPNAGFTAPTIKPWMSVNDNYPRINAAVEIHDANSVYTFWASVLRLRKEYKDVFVYGSWTVVDAPSQDIFAFTRQFDDQKVLVLCNWTERSLTWDPRDNGITATKDMLLNNYEAPAEALKRFSAHLDPTTYPRSHHDATQNIHLTLTYSPLDPTTYLAETSSAAAGATTLFLGTTRDTFEGRSVSQLSYTTYPPLALKTLQTIAEAAVHKHQLKGVSIAHRLGVVPIKEASIAIAVSAGHRAAAWRAGEEILEACKEKAEIWKREEFVDGGMEWRANADRDAEGNAVNKATS
ncbi:Molybdopterin synthase catalytic subunit [Penicillium ucsense]|uniref:Molybdopterin synthase catalytic subunit n=1 Tax=Penicillium ucsense TaxID=2839758 RepID=A0A8J8W5J6_9EURO|nr:Molybdopterin synthase catalytic subunit [Penicillium ucsense]KAF7737656.1 Molybdopterin synthase catalytic subunit [Penicillium ucsense]